MFLLTFFLQLQIKSLQLKIDEKSHEVQNQRDEHLRVRSLFERAQEEKTELNTKIESLTAQLSKRQSNVSSVVASSLASNSDVDLVSLQSEILEKNLEIQCLQEAIKQEKEHSANYRAISEATIATLEDVKEALAQAKAELESKQNQFDSKERRMEETIKTLEERAELSQQQIDKLAQERGDFVERENVLQKRISELEQSAVETENKIRLARDEHRRMSELLHTTQSKYEQEALSRLSDVKSLSEAHAKIEQEKELMIQLTVYGCIFILFLSNVRLVGGASERSGANGK